MVRNWCVFIYLCSPSIPAAISLLEGMAEVLGPNTEDINEVSASMVQDTSE